MKKFEALNIIVKETRVFSGSIYSADMKTINIRAKFVFDLCAATFGAQATAAKLSETMHDHFAAQTTESARAFAQELNALVWGRLGRYFFECACAKQPAAAFDPRARVRANVAAARYIEEMRALSYCRKMKAQIFYM